MCSIYDQCWSQHLYSYAGNNPINYVDPTGHYRRPTMRLIDGDIEKDKEYHLIRNGLYATMDEAAIAWTKQEMLESADTDVEHGALIYKKPLTLSDGTTIAGYGYSGTVYGSKPNSEGFHEDVRTVDIWDALDLLPYGIDRKDIVATHHTHGRGDIIFSTGDKNAMKDTMTPCYLAFISSDDKSIVGLRYGSPFDEDFDTLKPDYWEDPELNDYKYQGKMVTWIDFGWPLY